jgi:hypothetical protein
VLCCAVLCCAVCLASAAAAAAAVTPAAAAVPLLTLRTLPHPQHDGATNRQMNAANFSDHSGMTQESCWTFCRGFDPPFPFAGLENSNQCFCGTRLPVLPAGGSKALWCAAPNSTKDFVGCNMTKPCRNPHESGYCCCSGAPHCQHVSADGTTCLDSPNITCGGTGILQLFDISEVSCGTIPLAEAWCDESKPQGARVAALIRGMTAAEKVAALGTKTIGSPRLGVVMQFKEALHGLRYPCAYDVPSRNGSGMCPTSFPHAQLLAASFNRSLWADVGDRISTEVRHPRVALLVSARSRASFDDAVCVRIIAGPRVAQCLAERQERAAAEQRLPRALLLRAGHQLVQRPGETLRQPAAVTAQHSTLHTAHCTAHCAAVCAVQCAAVQCAAVQCAVCCCAVCCCAVCCCAVCCCAVMNRADAVPLA